MAAKGEGTIQAGEREVRVLFNNEALGNAEVEIGRDIMEIMQDAQARDTLGVRTTAILLRAGMETARRYGRMGGRPITLREAYLVMDEIGFAEAAQAVLISIAKAMRKENAVGEAEPEESEDDPNGQRELLLP